MNYYWLWLILLCSFVNDLCAQKGLHLLADVEIASITRNYRFAQHNNVLQNGWHGTDKFGMLNAGMALHYRFHKKLAIELGAQCNEIDLMVSDQSFIDRNHITQFNPQSNGDGVQADKGCYDFAKWYFSPYISGYYFLNTNSSFQPYFGGGFAWNQIIHTRSTLHSLIQYSATGEILQMDAQYVSAYMSEFAELGFMLYTGAEIEDNHHNNGIKANGGKVFIGVKYYIASDVLSGDYTNSLNNQIQYTDHVTASGSSISVFLRFGGRILPQLGGITPKPKHAKMHKKQKEKEIHRQPEKPILTEFENRKIEIKKNIYVKSKNIKIIIWDNETVDGDIFSLNLNNQWLLDKYILQSAKKEIKVSLEEGANYLTMHAVNNGTYGKCTAVMMIDDGKTRQQIVMDSDLTKSESIRIIVK